MSETPLAKARLIELKEDFSAELKPPDGKAVDVQFNPETLKVSFSNQIVPPAPPGGDEPAGKTGRKVADQAAGNGGQQFVGAGTTKLTLTLWFDVTAMTEAPLDDVRRLTADVIHFITPKKSTIDPTKLAPPGLRFSWGSFLFDGMVEALEETLEFFSPAGKPLRAQVALTVSQQKILVARFADNGPPGKRPGQRAFTPARAGDSLAGLAAANGKGGDWQSIAAANGIEDPLRLNPGALIDLNLGAAAGLSPPAPPALPAARLTFG
jgi:hypothetical protein